MNDDGAVVDRSIEVFPEYVYRTPGT